MRVYGPLAVVCMALLAGCAGEDEAVGAEVANLDAAELTIAEAIDALDGKTFDLRIYTPGTFFTGRSGENLVLKKTGPTTGTYDYTFVAHDGRPERGSGEFELSETWLLGRIKLAFTTKSGPLDDLRTFTVVRNERGRIALKNADGDLLQLLEQ